MAFTELEHKRIEKLVGEFIETRRPRPEIRDQVDLGFRIEGHNVEIYEIRPYWEDEIRKIEEKVARATYIRTRDKWKIFWMRADLRWHGYKPNLEVDRIDDFLKVVERDEYRCFWG
ncbi:MAG: hypothetical protein CVV64_18295 [Candidatus Wallbacteria bacterium HGW-Wallbacteria-1]|jgi:spore coat polysaccharide biosynthesis protein SpsF (cytidylyltransferase family)|uniref:DUF3024 domain-containing protein n=1 Tax=Candidatus Wallbacteria bacterium HGW-Wallbacteria-1 TaxID=2013854 RepID=A0A2N1PJN8_9BACT|nr:MAG: hypothetical protein CVV64_18295 [Candidatus Wallbacteria bacterium HGW-Wallbacteria-1]